MISNFIRALFGALFVATPTAAPVAPPEPPPVIQVIEVAHAAEIPPSATSSMSIPEKIRYYAGLYDVDWRAMERTIKCESNASSTRQSEHLDPTGPNGREDSWGLVQIHLPSHPTITREKAIDPDFALVFMAKHFARGEAVRSQMWTCYK